MKTGDHIFRITTTDRRIECSCACGQWSAKRDMRNVAAPAVLIGELRSEHRHHFDQVNENERKAILARETNRGGDSAS